MGNRHSRNRLEIELDESELLIVGYLRNIHQCIPSDDICQLCRHYYLLPQLIFLNDAAFHTLNITTPAFPTITTNLVNTNEASISPKPFDVSCYIPNIFKHSSVMQSPDTNMYLNINMLKMTKCKSTSYTHTHSRTPTSPTYLTLQPSMTIDGTNNNTVRYDAIFTRKLKWVNTEYKHIQTSLFFYIFENNEHCFDQNRGKYFMINSPYKESVNMEEVIFADNHGIIGIDSTFNVYQLKLDDVGTATGLGNGIGNGSDFDFKEISLSEDVSAVWNRIRGDGCHTFSSSIFLKGDDYGNGDVDMIFTMENVYDYDNPTNSPKRNKISTGEWVAKCAVYDLTNNEWVGLQELNYVAPLVDQYNFKCGLCTNDRRRNEVYLVSNIGHIAKYDFKMNQWMMIHCDYDDKEMRFGKKPLIWMYEYAPDIVYCAGSVYNRKDYKHELQLRKFDMRLGDKGKWMKCMVNVERRAKTHIDFDYLFM